MTQKGSARGAALKNPYSAHGLAREDTEAAIAYARWLHKKQFNDWMNVGRAEVGMPTKQGPVCLNMKGKLVYERIRKSRLKDAPILLGDADRRTILVALLQRQDEIRTKGNSR